MESYIGIGSLAALVVLTVVLWRRGLLFGPGNLSQHMCGCCSAKGFEPERDPENADAATKEKASEAG